MNFELTRLESVIADYNKELRRLVVAHKVLKPQQMDSLTKEFMATVYSEKVSKERLNSILRSMCGNIFISLGQIEVNFKIGPKLLIEYEKEWSKFAYVEGGNAEGGRKPEAIPSH